MSIFRIFLTGLFERELDPLLHPIRVFIVAPPEQKACLLFFLVSYLEKGDGVSSVHESHRSFFFF